MPMGVGLVVLVPPFWDCSGTSHGFLCPPRNMGEKRRLLYNLPVKSLSRSSLGDTAPALHLGLQLWFRLGCPRWGLTVPFFRLVVIFHYLDTQLAVSLSRLGYSCWRRGLQLSLSVTPPRELSYTHGFLRPPRKSEKETLLVSYSKVSFSRLLILVILHLHQSALP